MDAKLSYAGTFLLVCISLQVTNARISPLFNFGSGEKDIEAKHADDEYIINLPHRIHFAGITYEQLHVTPFGSLGFQKLHYEMEDWDGKREYNLPDPPFLAPLYFASSFLAERSSAQHEGIFYRLTNNTDTLHNLTNIVRESMVNSDTFTAHFAVIVTWVNVVNSIDAKRTKPNITNTFQLAVVANQKETYAIFNYDKVNAKDELYHAGINAGNFRGWTSVIPGHQEKEDLNILPYITGDNIEGRFIFRVSTDVPERGGCSRLPYHHHLTICRKFVGMFGGDMLEVSAPCLNRNMSLQCRFKHVSGKTVNTRAVMVNGVKARCYVPRLLFRGETSVGLSIDNGLTFRAYVTIQVALPQFTAPKVLTLDPAKRGLWDQTNVKKLSISWNPLLLSNNTAAKVDINLIGYKENRNEYHYRHLATIRNNLPVSAGEYDFDPQAFGCSSDCDYEIGLIEVRLTDISLSNSHLFLNSRVIPLGWYIAPGLKRKDGINWATKRCNQMVNDEKYHDDWLKHLVSCPCTLDQAVADFGRWIPSPDCNIYTVSTCRFHEEAIHCVRSTGSTRTASGSQCCYRKDRSLMYSMDTKKGSTPDKAAAGGAYPYDKINHVPQLSHWAWDVIPYYHCCYWSSNCDIYTNLRPTKNCKNYESPTTSIIFGDPHIISPDGDGFSVQIVGDYWLLKSENLEFQLQGHFNKSSRIAANLPAGKTEFSVLAAIALRINKEENVEIRMRYPHTKEYVLDVSHNGDYIHFNKKLGYNHVFKNVAILDNNRIDKQDNLTILTTHGFGIRVTAQYGMMQMVMTIPTDYKKKVTGILGTWNDRLDDASIIPANWTVKESESLFQDYRKADNTFQPSSSDDINRPADVSRVCGSDNFYKFCEHDYAVTGSSDVATVARQMIKRYKYLTDSQKKVKNCGHLDVKYAVLDKTNYTVGSTVIITGCKKYYFLKGHKKYMCVENGADNYQWKPLVDAKCVFREKAIANIAMIVGIAVAAVVVISIIVALAIYVRRKNAKKVKVKRQDPKEEERMVAMEPPKV